MLQGVQTKHIFFYIMRKMSRSSCWGSCNKGRSPGRGQILVRSSGIVCGLCKKVKHSGEKEAANIPTTFLSEWLENNVSKTRASRNTLPHPQLGFILKICHLTHKHSTIKLNQLNKYESQEGIQLLLFPLLVTYPLFLLKAKILIGIKTKS